MVSCKTCGVRLAEYIRSPRSLSTFTTLKNTFILWFSEFTKVKVFSVASNVAIKKCLLKMKRTFNCPFRISKCPLSVLERCPSYRDLKYSKWLKKWQGPQFGARFIEVAVLSGCSSWGVWLYRKKQTLKTRFLEHRRTISPLFKNRTLVLWKFWFRPCNRVVIRGHTWDIPGHQEHVIRHVCAGKGEPAAI